MKLREAISTIQELRATTVEGSLASDQRQETGHQAVDQADPKETSQHSPEKIPVPLPM